MVRSPPIPTAKTLERACAYLKRSVAAGTGLARNPAGGHPACFRYSGQHTALMRRNRDVGMSRTRPAEESPPRFRLPRLEPVGPRGSDRVRLVRGRGRAVGPRDFREDQNRDDAQPGKNSEFPNRYSKKIRFQELKFCGSVPRRPDGSATPHGQDVREVRGLAPRGNCISALRGIATSVTSVATDGCAGPEKPHVGAYG